MWPTSNSIKALTVGIALALSSVAFADGPEPGDSVERALSMRAESRSPERFSPTLENEIVVSDRDFNHFVFPSSIVNGPIFPAGSPVLGQPVYLSNNTQLLLQLTPGADKPFNMIVELENGAVHKFWLRPRPVAGITKRVDGANERRGARMSEGSPITASARAADVELLKRLVTRQLTEDFQSAPLPPPTRFDKFTVVPLSTWTDHTTRQITMYSLVANPGQTAVVAAPEFYRPGITAISVDGDVVDVANSPTLYVIEEAGSNVR